MKILIIGGGGREHALAWKCAQSTQIEHVFVAPGNAGTALEPNVSNIDLRDTDIDGLLQFAKDHSIELTIVGPEAPLTLGIVDRFQQAGLACFGPSQQAAQLEASKAFSKDFMQRHHIPTATYKNFTDIEQAKQYIHQQSLPLVIKASGLAAGKGVVIAQSLSEALATAENMLTGKSFGEAGHEIVIEEFLQGEEASFMVITDGKHVLPLASSQDHKARDNGDQGPNTGGMGAYSPAPVMTEALTQQVMRTVIQPVIDGMQQAGTHYVGFLYAGLMISPQGQIKVLEFNCRMGDPETQPILLRLESDLVEICQAALTGSLDQLTIKWNPKSALGVVMTAGGYPLSYQKGDVISSLPQNQTNDVKVFHAGTKQKNGQVVTNGGRVLCVTALGNTVSQAQANAYAQVDKIKWKNAYYRTDIGYRAIYREESGVKSS